MKLIFHQTLLTYEVYLVIFLFPLVFFLSFSLNATVDSLISKGKQKENTVRNHVQVLVIPGLQ